MGYREYSSRLIYSTDVRKMANTFLYGTSYDLFTEYQTESSTARVFARRFMEFEGTNEMQFYLLMDFVTFIPFGEAGRAALAEQGLDVPTLKYTNAKRLLQKEGICLSEEESAKLKEFFDGYANDLQPVTPVGYANVIRKISDKLFNMIELNKCAGTLEKAKLLSFWMKKSRKRPILRN